MDIAQSEPAQGQSGQPGRSLARHQKLAYGSGDLGFLLVWQGCALFLLYFYTEILGLQAWIAGAIYLAGMVWDSVSDPIVATWAERRALRTGRYTPILTFAAIPVGLAYFALFALPAGQGGLTACLALVSHLLFRTAYTFASMAYNALPARLTSDSDARSSLSGIRVVGAALGGLAVALATPALVETQAGANGYRIAAACVGALAAVCLLACARFVREPALTVSGQASRHSFGTDLLEITGHLARNRPLRSLMLVMALGTVSYGFFTQNLLYVITHVMQRPDLTPVALAASAVTVIFAAPAWSALSQRTSKRLTMMIGLVVTAAGYAAFAATAGAAPGVALAAIGLIGLGSAAIPVMLWSMLPDVIDFGQAQDGKRVEARTFGLATFVQKTTAGLAALIAGGLLSLSGYAAGETIPDLALTVMTGLSGWAPALIMLVIAWLIRDYPIDRKAHQNILDQLTRSGD